MIALSKNNIFAVLQVFTLLYARLCFAFGVKFPKFKQPCTLQKYLRVIRSSLKLKIYKVSIQYVFPNGGMPLARAKKSVQRVACHLISSILCRQLGLQIVCCGVKVVIIWALYNVFLFMLCSVKCLVQSLSVSMILPIPPSFFFPIFFFFFLQLNDKRDLAYLEFRNTDTAISCNISSDSYSDMQTSRGPVYTINVIISESGYITVFFTNPVKKHGFNLQSRQEFNCVS